MDKFVKYCRALGDGKRMEIFRFIKQKNFCVGALAKKLGISQSAVSQHLRVLREAGLVYAEKRGYYVHYYISDEGLDEFIDRAQKLKEEEGEEPACPMTESSEGCCLEREEQ